MFMFTYICSSVVTSRLVTCWWLFVWGENKEQQLWGIWDVFLLMFIFVYSFIFYLSQNHPLGKRYRKWEHVETNEHKMFLLIISTWSMLGNCCTSGTETVALLAKRMGLGWGVSFIMKSARSTVVLTKVLFLWLLDFIMNIYLTHKT